MKLNKFDSTIKIMFLYIAMFLCFDYSLAQDAPFTVSASTKRIMYKTCRVVLKLEEDTWDMVRWD